MSVEKQYIDDRRSCCESANAAVYSWVPVNEPYCFGTKLKTVSALWITVSDEHMTSPPTLFWEGSPVVFPVPVT